MFHQIRFVTDNTNDNYILPIVNKVMQVPDVPKTLKHVGHLKHSNHLTEWTDSIFDNYEEIWNTGMWRKPLLKYTRKQANTILHPRTLFKVKHTELTNTYELYTCTMADVYNQIMVIDYNNSYAPTSSITSLRICLSIAESLGCNLYSLDISNAYANNIIENQKGELI